MAAAIDATMWSGAEGGAKLSNLTAPLVPEGTTVLNFVDRKANKVIWTAPSRKLDIAKNRNLWNGSIEPSPSC
jgi:hypothetical protein